MFDWLSSIFGGLLSFGQQMFQNDFNRKEAQKNRDFQSEEAELNRVFQSNEAALQRDWSAAEAERARDWNEEMYAKYNSLSGKIAQAEQAGVNPLFAVTGNAVSPMSTTAAAPSGASAGSVGTPSGATAASSFVDIVGSMLGFKKIQAETDLLKAEADKYRSESERTGWLAKLSEREYKIITEHDFDIQELESRIGLNNEQANTAFQLAGKYFEEAGKTAEEKRFMVATADDRAKVIEYDKLVKEFESSMSSALDSLDNKEKLSLKEWVSLIFKSILAMK